jgi:hypothetical protein
MDNMLSLLHLILQNYFGYSELQLNASFAVLCVFAPLREPFSHKGAKTKSIAKQILKLYVLSI